jgi:uncharacterized Zn finger protein
MNCARQTRQSTSQGLTWRAVKAKTLARVERVAKKAKPRRNWIQEERRKTLGDYTSFCLACGSVWRYFLEGESELPAACPHCGGETRHRCPECSAPFPSAFAVECEECGAAVRPPEVLGVKIRKPGR